MQIIDLYFLANYSHDKKLTSRIHIELNSKKQKEKLQKSTKSKTKKNPVKKWEDVNRHFSKGEIQTLTGTGKVVQHH